MSAENKNEFILLFRGTDWSSTLSPGEMQDVSNRWMAWFKDLIDQGKVLGGRPLDGTGKVVSGKGGRTVSDGPFAESKEAIGGYFLLQVETMEEAIAIAQQCPGLAHGAKVEVRPLMEACPIAKEMKPQEELAAA
jgi:hypothetical protein